MLAALLFAAITVSRINSRVAPDGVNYVGLEITGISETAIGVQIECLPSPCPWGYGYGLDSDNLNLIQDGPLEWFVGLAPAGARFPLMRAQECTTETPPAPCGPKVVEALCCTANCGDVIPACLP